MWYRINKLLWRLPPWAHGWILRITGFRLVKRVQHGLVVGYRWTNAWPFVDVD